MGRRIYIIAGEASGDQLGAHLLDGFAELAEDLEYRGIGGQMMGTRGFVSRFDMTELSVMGLVEVLPRLPRLLRRIRETAEDVVRWKPDILVTIDSPDFCLRVAKRVRKAIPGLKIVHYVAPSVWAWRPKRAEKMARDVDHVLALLPFEPPYMEAAGMSCDFVGHPIATVPQATPEAQRSLRESLSVPPDAPLLCLLPGSRMGEITRHAPTLFAATKVLLAQRSDLHVVIPAAPNVFEAVNVVFAGLARTHVLPPEEAGPARKFAAMAAADAALAVSGTVSLELAAQGTPMVIAYDAAWLTKVIVKRAYQLDTATLVNLVSETRAVPEFLFGDFTADKIAPAVLALLSDDRMRAEQEEAAVRTMELLGRGGETPGLRAARSVLSQL